MNLVQLSTAGVLSGSSSGQGHRIQHKAGNYFDFHDYAPEAVKSLNMFASDAAVSASCYKKALHYF